MSFRVGSAIFLAGAAGAAASTQLVQTTYSGFLIDYYCLSLVRTGGLSLDGSDVIVEPQEHTLHCLRDVPQCRDGYYLAERASDGTYGIKFKLDDASHDAVLALMDRFPVGSERDHELFAVTAIGMHSGDGVLRDATFTTCFEDIGCDGICNVTGGGSCDTPANPDYTLPARGLLVAHVVCMCLSWGCLLPLGVVWARNMRQSKWKPGGSPAWFQGHRTLQSVGVALQLLGFLFVILFKKSSHFQRPHEILGLVVVLLGLMQPLNAQLRHLECIGHPSADGTRTVGRKVWEVLHKGFGWACLILGVANVILGPIHASDMRFNRALVLTSAVFIGLSLGTLLITGMVLEARRQLGLDQSAVQPQGPKSPDEAEKSASA